MLSRRTLLATGAAASLPATAARAGSGSFEAFTARVKAEAARSGITATTLADAFAGVGPNARVIELDRKQPEFTLTWNEYRARIVSPARVADGRENWAANLPLLRAIEDRFGVDPAVVLGIWGLESHFGTKTGTFGVVEALATLAWEGRRASFFRAQLLDSLRILEARDVTPAGMTGSWAGAMGQPQFMPDSYLRYAVDFDGDGRRDIWTSRADSLASIANYLAHSGWQPGEPWGQAVRLPPGFDPALAGRDAQRLLGEWMQLGVQRPDGTPFSRTDVAGAVLLPGGANGDDAFMVYRNFAAIRRYNPSDFYALAVGLLGDSVAA
ncbi:MAG: lytic murein transglycosylase [Acetobacteraceae bacterium]|nr:lytic murein transglycosylase [Acetobacteraceae bacterium]